MPQQFHVLCCYQCYTYQVQQVKKVNKWSCKMCCEKQSIKKVHYTGSGADCRITVQRMNLMKGQLKEAANESSYNSEQDVHQYKDLAVENQDFSKSNVSQNKNKWEQYIEAEKDGSDENDTESNSFINYTWQREQKKGRKRKRYENNTHIEHQKVDSTGSIHKDENLRSNGSFDNCAEIPVQQSIRNLASYTTPPSRSHENKNTADMPSRVSHKSKWEIFNEQHEGSSDIVDENTFIPKVLHSTINSIQGMNDTENNGINKFREVQCSSRNIEIPRNQLKNIKNFKAGCSRDSHNVGLFEKGLLTSEQCYANSRQKTCSSATDIASSSGTTKWGKYVEAESNSDDENSDY